MSFSTAIIGLAFAEVIAGVFAGGAIAACPDDAAVDAYVTDFAKHRVSKGFGNDISIEDAKCAKKKLGKKLRVVLGGVIGYKAAFTNPAPQQRFGVSGPKWAICTNEIWSTSSRCCRPTSEPSLCMRLT
jgi:2-oxo-hept-3-ene-1,7-dioate hydratase